MNRRRYGRRDGYLYIIDCLRQVVAFAPKVIKSAWSIEYSIESKTLGANMNGRRNG